MYVKIVLEFYDLCIKFIQFLSYIFFYMFHNQIIYIKYIDDNDEISYMIPFLKLSFHNKYVPGISVYDPFAKLELCYVSYIKNSQFEQLVCSERCALNIQIKINHLNHNENYKRRHLIAKKFIFVEINQHNITDNYKRIGWSLIDEQITVKEYKKILQLSEEDATLDLTDAENLDIKKLSNDDIVV